MGVIGCLIALALILSFILVEVGALNNVIRPYKISDVSVSGISSGGYMAVQVQVAFSKIISGAAIFAGGPFYCAESDVVYAQHKCMEIDAGRPQVAKLVDVTLTDAALLLIDPPTYLSDDKVYIFSGSDDSVVDPIVVNSLMTYYLYFMKANNIVADFDVEAEHCMPTVDYGEACKTLASPYIGKCGFDGAGEAFKVIYGSLAPKVDMISANFQTFDQTPFITPSRAFMSSLSKIGYIYVPTNCSTGVVECHLHISFHGCEQNLELIGNQYAQYAGYNVWAESNNVIVVYPYASPSSFIPFNPNGCWDWWAYSGFDYGLKTGVQMMFIKSLIDELTGGTIGGVAF